MVANGRRRAPLTGTTPAARPIFQDPPRARHRPFAQITQENLGCRRFALAPRRECCFLRSAVSRPASPQLSAARDSSAASRGLVRGGLVNDDLRHADAEL